MVAGSVARDAADVVRISAATERLDGPQGLESVVTECRACPRLVEWREKVAREKRAAFADELYWGRPVPGWGDPKPRVLIVGLAPAAHGGNRTGRVFTGDRSGDWLFESLHKAGLAALDTSTSADDGQRMVRSRILAAVRCAPPDNKPTTTERDTCAPWLNREIALTLPYVQAILALGSFAWASSLRSLQANGLDIPKPRPRFAHAAETPIGGITLIGSYHPSQQNTFTGKLTHAMLDDVCRRTAEAAGLA
jgi:uracil-DNA glycosylase